MTGIDFNQSEQHLLSIRLSADGFSFSICHPSKTEEVYFMSYPVNVSCSMTANLKDMIASVEALKYTYGKVNVLVDTERFTTVPFDLFEDEQLETLFYYNLSKIDNETVLCNVLSKSNCVILFGMDKHTHQLLDEHFPHVRIFSSVSPQAEYFSRQSNRENCRNLYAHICKRKMEVFAFDRGKLLLINSFSCKEMSDRVYYLLYIWQQLGFSQENDKLQLAGDLKNMDELSGELRKFLRQVELMPKEKELSFDLHTLLLCE